MRIRKFLPLTLLFAFFSQLSWASGPFHPTCEKEQKVANSTLKELSNCLERVSTKKPSKRSPDTCAELNVAHQAAVASMEKCLAAPITQSEETKP